MTTLVLLRHGRSDANAAGVLAGRLPGVSLTDDGIAQARSVADVLADVPIAAVYSSPSQRCRETAALLTGRVLLEPGLDECDYGDWSGRKLTELASEALWERIQREPSAVTFPGGESMARLRDRVVEAARRITGAHEGVVVAVTHGDVIKAILADALAMGFDDFQRLNVSPASLSVVDYSGARPLVVGVNMGTDVAAQLRSAHVPSVGGGDVAAG